MSASMRISCLLVTVAVLANIAHAAKIPRAGEEATSCLEHTDCSLREICLEGQCSSPCKLENICGANTECQVRSDRVAICTCKPGLTGDPFVACAPEATTMKPRESGTSTKTKAMRESVEP